MSILQSSNAFVFIFLSNIGSKVIATLILYDLNYLGFDALYPPPTVGCFPMMISFIGFNRWFL